MCIHTWFGYHSILYSLFNSNSDGLCLQLFLTRWVAAFADDVKLHRTLSLRACGRLNVPQVTFLQGLQT